MLHPRRGDHGGIVHFFDGRQFVTLLDLQLRRIARGPSALARVGHTSLSA